MNVSTPTPTAAAPAPQALPRTIGLHGRVAVQWAMAGGVTLGGIVVAAMTLSGRLSAHALFLNATALFVVGALVGLVHGMALGYFGRPLGMKPRRALGDLARSFLYAVPAVAVAWLAAIWVAMSYMAYYEASLGALVGVGVGWMLAAGIVAFAALNGWRALRNAYARWPERRAGSLVVAGGFAALLMLFLADRPEIWGLRLRLTETGAVLLAAAVAIWIVGPTVTLALRLAWGLPSTRPLAGLVGDRRWTPRDLVVGLVSGLVIGLIAVPFAGPAAPATAGSVVVEVSQALVNEVLLRLVVVTGAAWLLLRWGRLGTNEAALAAVGIATVLQVALYTPGALAVGFASPAGLTSFLLLAVAVPAAAFGLLYWRRGFGTALVADATALLAILLLA